jgi:hypothetical protein
MRRPRPRTERHMDHMSNDTPRSTTRRAGHAGQGSGCSAQQTERHDTSRSRTASSSGRRPRWVRLRRPLERPAGCRDHPPRPSRSFLPVFCFSTAGARGSGDVDLFRWDRSQSNHSTKPLVSAEALSVTANTRVDRRRLHRQAEGRGGCGSGGPLNGQPAAATTHRGRADHSFRSSASPSQVHEDQATLTCSAGTAVRATARRSRWSARRRSRSPRSHASIEDGFIISPKTDHSFRSSASSCVGAAMTGPPSRDDG